MRPALLLPLVAAALLGPLAAPSQAQVEEDQLGAWYMYFFSTRIVDTPWGFQGDAQFRNWDMGGDLEQLLLRGGVTYSPEGTDALFTLGYANITSGEFGSGDDTTGEDRLYQEALLPQRVGSRLFLRHRYRTEQRWVEDQDFRTRFRYAIFADVPLNRPNLDQGAVYLALYNEIFVNGERSIGDGRRVEFFDRNRLYGGLGYGLTDRLRMQVGWMRQTTSDLGKNQLQFSLHQRF